MHFAVGMVGGAAVTATVACFYRRALPLTPLGMTLGGLWAILPDTPRLVRVDFPSLRSLPGATAFGDKATEAWLHQIGDLFFLHRTLDHHATDLSLAGLFAMIALYTMGIASLLALVACNARASPGSSNASATTTPPFPTPPPSWIAAAPSPPPIDPAPASPSTDADAPTGSRPADARATFTRPRAAATTDR